MEKNAAAPTQEKAKLDALRRYLLNALDAYKQGNPAQLNQIFQEISSEEIEVNFLKSWLNTFSRILVETLSQPNIDCSLIIDFVLHKSKMFHSTSKVHVGAFEFYQKFCLSLISVKNSYLPVIMKLLIQNLVPREMYEEETCSQNFKIIIGNNCFKNLNDLKTYVTAIIKNPKYELSTVHHSVELESEHTKFMYELFSYHPKAQEKLRGLTKIFIGYNNLGPRPTKCFFIEKEAFLREDISYLKACSSAYDTFAEQNLDNLLNPGQATMTENILSFLAKLLKLYPLSVSQLPSLLRDLYPHRRLDENIQRIFLINILKLAIKFERVRDIVVNICLESLIQIDVEIKAAADGNIKDSISLEMAKKLDWLLIIFFDYYDYCFAIRARKEKNCFGEIPKRPQQDAEAKENKEKMLDVFMSFLNLFQTNLLMTYQSKYVQFIYFYLCSYTEIYPEFIGMFLTRLVNNLEDTEQTKFVRMNSVNYLRSMILRANFIPTRTVNKALEILNNFIKKYDKLVRKRAKKQAAGGSDYDDTYHFERIELNASSNYRDRITQSSLREQESEYNQLFQKFNIYYYAVYAEICIFIHKADLLVANNRLDEFRSFTALLRKTHNRYKTFKFFSKAILLKFKEVQEKFHDSACEDVEKIINEELESIEEEEKKDKIRGDIFIDDYQPFGPNFLNRSKKILVQNYTYIGNEEENGGLGEILGTEIANPNEEPATRSTLRVYDTLDDEILSDMSSMSKHDTDVSNDQLKKQGKMPEKVVVKRGQEPLEGLNPEKKLKTSDYLTKHRIGTGV